MAAKLVVALTCFALCNANPAYLNGYIFRNGRGHSVGQGYTNNPGGRATGSATINGGVIQAYGTASTDDQNPLVKNVYGIPTPGEAVAKAEVYDTPDSIVEARNTPIFYTVPIPANLISYQQNFETPAQLIYEYPANIAQSSAVLDENSEAITSARADGSGSAVSSASTQGTSSSAKTYGSGLETVSSNVNNDFGVANTIAKTQGIGSATSNSQTGLGSASAASQTNGGYASSSANNAQNSAVVSTNSQGIASSKANINRFQDIASPVMPANLRGFHWRFGTAVPTPGQAQVYSQSNGGVAKSTAQTDGVVTTADAQGFGSANANAHLPGGFINSAANNNIGYGLRHTAGNDFGSSHSNIDNGLGNIKSYANSNGYGNANSHADINEQGSLSSISSSNGFGTATSSADSAPSFAFVRADGLPYIYSHNTVNTRTSGQGSASARTSGINAAYRVANSVANSFGNGAAQANASA